MTGRENLQLVARLFGQDRRAARASSARVLELLGLTEAADRLARTYSGGMRRKLDLGASLVGAPRLLLLDEPTSALDPVGRRIVRGLLEELRGRGVAILLNSHLLSEVELVCDRVAIIARGRLIKAGSPEQLAGPGGVEVETAAGVMDFAGAGREDAPQIVAELVAAGERVYRVEVRHSSLEDVYLEAVGGQTG
jgi:ABC-2 type transport system ATP-binding protein